MNIKHLATRLEHVLQHLGHSDLQGTHRTHIPQVGLYRDPVGNAKKPLLYQSGLILMLQGHKSIYLNGEVVHYGAGDYLLLGMPHPAECEAFPEADGPILSMVIDIPISVLSEINQQLPEDIRDTHKDHKCRKSLKRHQLNTPLVELCNRLLDVIVNPTDAKVLGPGLVKEIIYRIIQQPHGHLLTDLLDQSGHYARVASALKVIHSEYQTPISVEYLAEKVNLSVSSFHRVFREIAMASPAQYLKKIRLTKAKELITLQGKRASEAAIEVGYSSISQFSREYKRYFDESPSESKSATKKVKATAS